MTGIGSAFAVRESGLGIQFIKYALCGGVATLVDMAVFLAMSWLVLPALRDTDPLVRRLRLRIRPVGERSRAFRFVVNTLVAFLFSNLTAYLLNVAWVFESGRHERWVEVSRFLAVSGISVGVAAAVGWAMIRWFHWSTSVSYVTKVTTALLFNFAGRKWFVF